MTSSETCADDACTKLAMSEVIDLCRGHHDKRHDALLIEGLKVCTSCGETKMLDSFGRAKEKPSGVRSRCKVCEARRSRSWKAENPEYAKKWRDANRDKWNSYRLSQQFGLTQGDVDAMFAAQNGSCSICGKHMDKPNVDHCHESGRVRALLCRSCNLGLGNFQDDPERILRAAAYVREHRVM